MSLLRCFSLIIIECFRRTFLSHLIRGMYGQECTWHLLPLYSRISLSFLPLQWWSLTLKICPNMSRLFRICKYSCYVVWILFNGQCKVLAITVTSPQIYVALLRSSAGNFETQDFCSFYARIWFATYIHHSFEMVAFSVAQIIWRSKWLCGGHQMIVSSVLQWDLYWSFILIPPNQM